MEPFTYSKVDLKRAKVEHKVSKVSNPILFHERRVDLASYLIQSLHTNTPHWGSVTVNFDKTF